MSLREKQKARRSREIISAAATLFGKNGYSNTTIEEIADHAFVGPATVYNYFGSKDGLLKKIVEIHIVDRRAERQRFLASPPDDVDDAISGHVDLLIDRAFVLVNREIWRQILASSIANGTNRDDLHQEVTGALVDQFESLFQTLQARGDFAREVDLRDLAEAAMGIADFHFYRLVSNDELTIEETKDRIIRQLQLLLGDLRR